MVRNSTSNPCCQYVSLQPLAQQNSSQKVKTKDTDIKNHFKKR